jgi:precorrin-3B synthase
LLRIVQALDGGICRIKLAGGELTAAQAEVVSGAAEQHAGGVIEATNRSNLQIRGIGPRQQALIDALLAAGLGPREAAGDDVRNLMLSPSAGIDPLQIVDVRPLAAQILQSLESNPRLHALSAKFAVQVDGGEGLAMLEHHHDLWLSAFEADGQLWWAFGLAGCPGQDQALGAVLVDQGHALVMAVLERFLERAGRDQSRMRELFASPARDEAIPDTPQTFIDTLGLPLHTTTYVRPAATFELGVHPQSQPGLSFIATLAPLGRLTPAMLRGAARLAREYGDGTLRMTPWQGLLLPNLARPHVALAELTALGFITSAEQPLAGLIACTGSAGCAKGLADTKADAKWLAQQLPSQPPLSVHLSGCARSCASAQVAPATLLATSPGHYDLYVRDASQPGFGALQARHLSLDAAAHLLRGCSRSDTHD